MDLRILATVNVEKFFRAIVNISIKRKNLLLEYSALDVEGTIIAGEFN